MMPIFNIMMLYKMFCCVTHNKVHFYHPESLQKDTSCHIFIFYLQLCPVVLEQLSPFQEQKNLLCMYVSVPLTIEVTPAG